MLEGRWTAARGFLRGSGGSKGGAKVADGLAVLDVSNA